MLRKFPLMLSAPLVCVRIQKQFYARLHCKYLCIIILPRACIQGLPQPEPSPAKSTRASNDDYDNADDETALVTNLNVQASLMFCFVCLPLRPGFGYKPSANYYRFT